MQRSKSRSGSIEFGQKNHYSSVFSRTLSASKLCRGGNLVSQIDSNALKSAADKKSSKNRINRPVSMGKPKGELEAELHKTREQLGVAEVERDKEANIRVSKPLDTRKVQELTMELKHLEEMLSKSREEGKVRDDRIKSLELELGKAKQLELDLNERDSSLVKLKDELKSVRESETKATELLRESQKKIRQLEDEAEVGKQSESRNIDKLAVKSEELEQTKIELEESKDRIASLVQKIELLQELSKQNRDKNNGHLSRKDIGSLESSSNLAKEKPAHAEEEEEDEKKASLKVKSLLNEIEFLKSELNSAISAEERSAKAMEDLALALKEVTTESNQTKQKLSNALLELEQVKGESEQLKSMVRSADERHHKISSEAELHKNTADRLRLEAEDAILAWNGKEMEFVSYIKKAEEETGIVKRENATLVESLKAAEDMTQAAKEETNKLRDILKQAISEANVAKAAADIAREENAKLRDSISERDEALNFLTEEHKSLQINMKPEEKEKYGFLDSSNSEDDEPENNEKRHFSISLDDLKITNVDKNSESDEKILDEDPEKAEALKGSIFDSSAVTPKSELRTPKTAALSTRRRGYSLSFAEETATPPTTNTLDLEQLDITQDGTDRDRNSHRRRKTMFWRVGDLLMIGRSFHRKDPSTESAPPVQP